MPMSRWHCLRYRMIIKCFNPSIKFAYLFTLNTCSQLEKTPEAVADFLFNGEGLSKKSIGDYLGEKEVSSHERLHCSRYVTIRKKNIIAQ